MKAAIELYEQNDGSPVVSGFKADTIPFKFFVSIDGSFGPYSKLFAVANFLNISIRTALCISARLTKQITINYPFNLALY